ncbi:2OG-Fe(II) oxygenase family protein [Nannocystaceae bacterium ST9]
MHSSPTISIAAFRAGSERERLAIAEQAYAAYERERHLMIVDHGVPDQLLARLPSIAAPFFASPLADKLEHLARTGLGYLPSPDSLGLPVANNPNSPHEQFIVHLDERKNPWPVDPPEFREVVASYNRACEQLCRLLVEMMALGCGIPVERVRERDDAPNASFLKFINWPSPRPGDRVGAHRLAPHYDNAAVSLLKNDDRPNGLRVQRQDGEWVEAYSSPGAILVLFGEQLANWTEGRVTPSWHEIVNHESIHAGDGARLSSCYFYNPEPMLDGVLHYLEGRARYCKACDAALAGETVVKQTWTRRFRWAAFESTDSAGSAEPAPTSTAGIMRHPPISLAPFFVEPIAEPSAETLAQRKRVAAEVVEVYARQRYFCITDHGMAKGLAEHTEELARRYFDQPIETKLEQLAKTGCGYLPSPLMIGMPATKVSRNEVFLAHRDPAHNPWPSTPAGFRETVAGYNHAAEQLSLVLLRVLALGLDLPEQHFADQAGASASFLKLFSFPRPRAEDGPQGQYRLAAHHDYSAVSIIRCVEQPNGLQALTSTNEWVDVYPDPDSLVVFVGEQMTRWTEGKLPPSWHRVENPQPDHPGDGSRTSTCYFFNPECMAGDVEGYFEGRAEFSSACAAHLRGRPIDRNDWESPARRI